MIAPRHWCVLGALALAGCGYAAAAIARQVSERNKDDNDPVATPVSSPSVANVTTPFGNQFQDVILTYLLIDAESDLADVSVTFEFSTNGGSTWSAPAAATERVGAPSEGTTALTTSGSGLSHVFVWNSFADVGGVNGLVRLTFTPNDPGPPLRVGVASTTAVGGFPVLNRLIATVAGGGSGVLGFPGHVIPDASGNLVVADTFNHRIQVLNTQTGTITVAGVTIGASQLGVIAGTGTAGFNGDNQSATQAQLSFPSAVAVDGTGNIWVADSLNHRIRRIDTLTGFITTMAGTGSPGTAGDNSLATTAQLDTPRGIAFDGAGNLLVADTGNASLRVLNRQSTTITMPPGGGSGVTVAANFLRTFAGTLGTPGATGDGAAATAATLDTPWHVAVDSNGHAYVADSANHVIRCINLAASGSISVAGVSIGAGDIDVVAGRQGFQGFGGDGASATTGSVRLDTPHGIAVDGGNNLLIADTANSRIRCVNTTGGSITRAGVTIASNNIDTIAGGGATPGANDGDAAAATSARLQAPEGVCALTGNHVAISDTGIGRIRAVNVGTGSLVVAGVTIGAGNIDTVAGTIAAGAQILKPAGVVRSGNLLFVADFDAHIVWQVDLTTGVTTAFAGSGLVGISGDGGAPTMARLRNPSGVALDGAGNLYLVQAGNGGQSDRVRVVNRQSTTQTLFGVMVAPGNIATVAAGSGPSTFVDAPSITIIGSDLYIAHRGGHRILKVDSAGSITTLTGGTQGFTDGVLGSAQFDSPGGISATSGGDLLVADTANHAVRFINLGASGTTVFGVSVGASAVGTVMGIPPATGPSAGFNGDNQAGTATLLNLPQHAVLEASGDLLCIDGANERIRRLSASSPFLVQTLCGTGAGGFNGDGIPPGNAHIQGARFLFLDSATPPNLFFSDTANRRVRRFTP